MDDWKLEIDTDILLDKCKCCLGDGPLKDLWLEHCEDGRSEIYGEMLNECFDLSQYINYNTEIISNDDKICDSCICRLRDALEFKREVLACGQLRFEYFNNGMDCKKECDGSVDEELEMAMDHDPDSGCHTDQNFEDVEYLELDDNDTTDSNQFNSPPKDIMPNISETKSVMNLRSKTLKNLKTKEDRSLKIHKQESSENTLKIIQKPAKDFNMLRKTLASKSLKAQMKSLDSPKKSGGDYVEEGECLEDVISDNDPDSECTNEQVFDDVEYLELDDNDVNDVNQANTSEIKPVTTRRDEKPTKWPRKKKKHEKLKTYKQYIRQDMLKAVETVQKGLLSTREAAKEFNVPRKTLATKLLMAQREKDNMTNENRNKIMKKENHYQFIEEVKKILTYTNAVPFKTKATRYFCTYCSTDGPCFEEPDELRAHTRTEHVDDKTRNIEMVLRPQYQNEVIKMDIDALHCTVCCTIIPTWTDMFKHLEDVHNIELDQAYTKVIPYILTRDLICALCSESFPNYHHLDSHMNSHYASYICQECGDTFLSGSRLSKHIMVHNTGRYPCEECGKVFARDRYRQKHYDHVHKQEHNIKCLYCPEKFYGTFQRHLHMVEKHKEKVRITTCELCGMKFEWRRYYVAHMRRKHNIRTI